MHSGYKVLRKMADMSVGSWANSYKGKNGEKLLYSLGPLNGTPSSWFVMFNAGFIWRTKYNKYVGRTPEYMLRKQIGINSPAILKIMHDNVEEYALLYENILYLDGKMPYIFSEYNWQGIEIIEIIREK